MSLTSKKFKVAFFSTYFIILILMFFYSPLNVYIIMYLGIDCIELVHTTFFKINSTSRIVYTFARIAALVLLNVNIFFGFTESGIQRIIVLVLSVITIEIIRLFIRKIPFLVAKLKYKK